MEPDKLGASTPSSASVSASGVTARPLASGSLQTMGPEKDPRQGFTGQPSNPYGIPSHAPSLSLASTIPVQGTRQTYPRIPPPVRPNGPTVPFQASLQSSISASQGPPSFIQPPSAPTSFSHQMPPAPGLRTGSLPLNSYPSFPLGPPLQASNVSQSGSSFPPPATRPFPPYPYSRAPPPPVSMQSTIQASTQPWRGQAVQSFAQPPSLISQRSPSVPYPGVAAQQIDGQSTRGPSTYPGAPPLGGMQGLIEDFQSLSIASVPGSAEAGIDATMLPRPLDESDLEGPSSSDALVSNCHSRYLRLTTNVIPNSNSLVARWHLPLGAVVHPLAEAPAGEEVPIVNFGSAGIVRCRRCRTYINPYATFADGGRRWRCNVCSLLNDVPGDYFSPLDANGRRRDADKRPELSQGSVEFVASTEYMVRPPMPPTYFFLIDVSQSAVKSGMIKIVAQTIRASLDRLPGFPRTQIGFLTFDSTLHYYNLKSSLTQPQMVVVADLDDPFVPLPDDLLVNLPESRHVVESLLDSLPSMFDENMNIESAFGPALKAAFMVMSQLGGKLLIFQSTLPSLGVGRLKLRGDDPRIYGTDKEHTIRNPEDAFYKQMAAEFTRYQIGVNLYVFSDTYTDLASLGALAKYTGGQSYYYPWFQSDLHGEKLSHELGRDLTREIAWEAVMRVRCGKGVRFTNYHGHFMLRTSDLLALPAVDCDKAFAMQLSLEESILITQTVYFQVALLYTSSSGERRIRVHTRAVPVVADLGELYRNADVGAIMSLLSRLAIEKSLSAKLEDARHITQLNVVKSLREYHNLYATQHRLSGRLIYPESLKLLPLFGLALCKSLALRGGYADATADERSAAGFNLMIIPIKRLLKLLYPNLFRIDEYLCKGVDNVQHDIKRSVKPLPLTAERLDPRAAFLYDDGFRFVLWLGRVLPSDFITHLLGVEAANSPDMSKLQVIEQNNELSRNFLSTLKSLRSSDLAFYQHCNVVRQGEQPREGFLLLFNLVEDRIGGTSGYVDWMVQIYRQVQQRG